MDAKNLSHNHYFLNVTDDVNAICKPLICNEITYFCYLRLFSDHTVYGLTTHGESLYNHFKMQFPFDRPRPKKIFSNKFHYLPFLDSMDIHHNQLRTYRDLYNADNPIYFVEQYENYSDIFVYASKPNNHDIINFYLNNIDLLEKFKFYFKDQAKKMITQLTKNKISIAPYLWTNFSDNVTVNNKNDFQKELSAKHYAIHFNQTEISITQRELDVLQALSKGNTIKEVANEIQLSSRTIESYLRNVRNKFGMQRKSDILKILIEAKLI